LTAKIRSDHDVEPAEAVFGGFHHRRHRVVVGHVGAEEQGLAMTGPIA
jgi:hypothetical protein